MSRAQRGHHRRRLLAVSVVVTVLLATAGAFWFVHRDNQQPVPPTAPIAKGPAIGVFVGTDAAKVKAFEQWLGLPLDIVSDFSARDTWEQIARPRYMLDEWAGTGLRAVYGVAMLPVQDPTATIQAGARGDYDKYFRTLAEELVASGHADAVLRIGWEFNLKGSRWGTPDSDAFVDYWRRIVNVMRGVEGQRMAFDWNVNNGSGNGFDAVNYYPGNDVVDFVGVDVYDQSGRKGTYPYPPDCDDVCRQERQVRAWEEQIYGGDRGLSFWRDFAAQHNKQVSLPEWGLWSRPDGTGGGDDPFFIERMHEFISDPDNNVGYHAYFESDGGDGQHSLTKAFPQSAEVFRYLWTR